MKKFIKSMIALVAVAAVGFAWGLSSTPEVKLPAQVAYETSPGPYGSGELGDWQSWSHGTQCFKASGGIVVTIRDYDLNGCSEQVLIMGDSITAGGRYALADRFAEKGKSVYINYWSGRPTAPAVDWLVAQDSLPDVVIMATGTNDIFNPTVMAAQIKRAQAFVNSLNATRTDGVTTQLFWVDVQATRWPATEYTERNDQRNSMAVNLAIYQNMPVNHVIQWTQRFMSNPGLLTTYLADGVHPKTSPLYVRPDGVTENYSTSYNYWAASIVNWTDTLGGI
jgi:lysophospholipase L1-like esterase